MSFRIEEKLYLRPENLIDFKKYVFQNDAKNLYQPRKINSLYFDNLNLDMYSGLSRGFGAKKKIRIRNYPYDNDKNII